MAEPDGQLIALGRSLRQLREERSISRDELATTTGLAPSRLYAIEAGRFDPPYDLLLALAAGLRVKLGALISRATAETKAGDA